MSRRIVYSPLHHLFSAIWLNYDPRKKYVIMVTAYTIYGDASGNSVPGDIFCVAGFGSTAQKWIRFEQQWNVLLKRYDIPAPFHMTDFANGGGKYKHWRQNHGAQEAQFFVEAIKLLKRNVNKSFGVGVAIDDLKCMQATYQLPDDINNDSPYAWCTLLFYHQVSAWFRKQHGPSDTIEVIFERGDMGQPAFPNRLRKLYPKLELPIFRDKSCAPLQAADMLAWEFRKDIRTRQLPSPTRESFVGMFHQIPHHWQYCTLGDLSRICENHGFPKRSDSDVRPLTSRRKHSVE